MTENAIPPRPSPNPHPHTQSRLMLAGTLVVGVISTFVVLYALFNRSGTSTQSGVNTGAAIIEGIPYTGVEIIDPPRAVQDFTLIDQDGQPLSLTLQDMASMREAFVASTRRAVAAGFDWLELHCAHGYLLASFVSPLTNRRTDAYGGQGSEGLENRCRFPLEVFRAMREVWPQDRPMSVRISAHDWAPGGTDADDAVQIACLFKQAGCDLIDVSSGQTTRQAKPVYGRMYQTPFADRIRNEAGIRTIAVGAITQADQVNSIIAAGRADLCAIARPHLADPAWTLHETAALQSSHVDWPRQYLPGRDQLYREAGKLQPAAGAAAVAEADAQARAQGF